MVLVDHNLSPFGMFALNYYPEFITPIRAYTHPLSLRQIGWAILFFWFFWKDLSRKKGCQAHAPGLAALVRKKGRWLDGPSPTLFQHILYPCTQVWGRARCALAALMLPILWRSVVSLKRSLTLSRCLIALGLVIEWHQFYPSQALVLMRKRSLASFKKKNTRDVTSCLLLPVSGWNRVSVKERAQTDDPTRPVQFDQLEDQWNKLHLGFS